MRQADEMVQRPALTLAELVGARRTFREIAIAANKTERWVYRFVDEQRIPYIRLGGTRYVDPADVTAALLRERDNAAEPPRGRGRPRKAA